MIQILESLKKYLDKRRTQNFTELPSGIRIGLAEYLTPGEEVLLTLRNFRAIYKAPTLIDSNAFFNSWFILTNSRIIIARNSSSFKRFRDISHNTINKVYYETRALESTLTIHSPGAVDIIVFLREARRYCEDLDRRINKAIEDAQKDKEYIQISGTILCPHCGSKIHKESKFCSECGAEIRKA